MSVDQAKPFFFFVTHITKDDAAKLLYGIKYNGLNYYLYKSHGINDCEQLDHNPKLAEEIFDTMCKVITEIEKEYERTPPLEFINFDIFNCLVRARNPRYGNYKPNL